MISQVSHYTQTFNLVNYLRGKTLEGKILANRPVPHKLKHLRNVNGPQLTKVVQHPVVFWRP